MSEKYIGIDLGSEFLKIAVHENNRICGEISGSDCRRAPDGWKDPFFGISGRIFKRNRKKTWIIQIRRMRGSARKTGDHKTSPYGRDGSEASDTESAL